MKVYIKGMGNISPQQTWGDHSLLEVPLNYKDTRLRGVEPDYSDWIDAKTIRRMSRVMKMGVASALIALKEAGITMPDGIITATGYGCMEDTGAFLNRIIQNKEETLNPTPFIQSTHNTIGSQIAQLLQCQAYNQTFTHGAFSFESAMLDTFLQLSESPEKTFLTGGIDELTSVSHAILSRFGILRSNLKSSLGLFNDPGTGTLNGEGSAYFVLSAKKATDDIACIDGLSTFYKPDAKLLREGLDAFLSDLPIQPKEIDLILLGKSGNEADDHNLDDVCEMLFPAKARGVFKHLCGEYPVSSAFACWLAARMLKEQMVPDIVLQKGEASAPKNILIINQYFSTHYSAMLLSAC